MLDVYLAALGGLALVLGLFSRKLRDLPVSGPLLAFATGVVLSPSVAGVAEIAPAETLGVLSVAAELVIAMSVMGVALRFSLGIAGAFASRIALLVGVVMLGMAVIVAGLGLLALPISAAGALVLGAALAPTDPVLASSIVAGKPAEKDLPLRVRALISLESGANDGMAAPLVILGIAVAVGGTWSAAAIDVALALGVGVVTGLLLGDGTGRLLLWAERHREIEHAAFLAFTLSLTALVLGTAELLGGSGILAVFAAGLAYNRRISVSERSEEWEVQEAINTVFVLPVFALFGIAVPWRGWLELGWAGIGFAIAVLLLRRLPLVVALRRPLSLSAAESTFAGWFGPVGVAALFYLARAGERGAADPGIWEAGSLVVAASVLAHGVSSTPLRKLFARRAAASPANARGG